MNGIVVPVFGLPFLCPLDVHTHPLYVHAHSKTILMQALSADTEFLVDHNVMDYSLLVGVCSDSQQIVVGVIGKWDVCVGGGGKKVLGEGQGVGGGV